MRLDREANRGYSAASMRNYMIAALMGIATLALSQNRLPSVVRPAGPHWETGSVKGRTYKNSSIGVELTAAPELQFGSPELKGQPGSLPLIVTIIAAAEPKPGIPRPVMAFYADAMAYYPENRRSSDAYMGRVVFDNQRRGLFPADSNGSEREFGGVTFLRKDFAKDGIYETVLVRACRPQALVFIFTGSSRDPVDKLIAATQLKLDLAASGCGS